LTVDSKLRATPSGDGALGRDPRDPAGLLLGRLTALPALVLLPFLLTSFPLLLIGYFKPVPVLVLWLALTAAVVPYVWRRIPSVTGAPDWGTPHDGRAKPTPRWALWSLVAVSVAFGAFQAVFHSQFVIVQLDAASYLQFANWISHHGSTTIPLDSTAFGGYPAGLTYQSAAFYQVGNHIVPQFMAGLPMLLSLGFWAGGFRAALFWGPVLGALGVFTFGGLVARLVGPRWAPFAALAIGITIPEAYVSRNTYSEPLAQILFLGALALWIDVQRTDRGAADAGPWRSNWRTHARSASHVLAGITGLLFGVTLLVRIDGPADILFVIPYCGLLILRRQRQVVPLIAGLLVGTVYGLVDGLFLTFPYLKTNGTSVGALGAAIVVMIIGTVVAVRWLRRRGSELRNPPKPWLVKAVTILPFVVIAAFAARPYVERNWPALQYAPLSLRWIYWYTGATTIAFAVIAVAMLGRRCLKRQAPVWVLPLVTFCWAIVWFLLRPAITPHQPYASRRLVADVLPGLILLAVWLAAWLARKSRSVHLVNVPSSFKRAPRVFVIVCCAGAIFLPPMIGNFGLGLKSGGPLGVMPYSDGLALQRTYVGEIAAMDKLCTAIPKGTSVLIVDNIMMQEFGQAIRGMCNVPVAGAVTTPPVGSDTVTDATILGDVRAIENSGHTPLVIGRTSGELEPLLGKGTVKFILNQGTTIDEHTIFGTPRNPLPQTFTAYSWEPVK
jgi:hypothetical protein